MILRSAKAEDIDFIREIEMDPAYSPFISLDSKSTHLAQIQDECITLGIYEIEEKRVGFLLGLYNPNLQIYELRRLALTIQGKGLGKQALLLAFKDAFENFGAQRLWLDVYEYNERGIALYRSMGMVHEGILRRSDKKQGGFCNQWLFSILKEEYNTGLDDGKYLCNN